MFSIYFIPYNRVAYPIEKGVKLELQNNEQNNK